MTELSNIFAQAFERGCCSSQLKLDECLQEQVVGLRALVAAIDAKPNFSAVLDPRLEGPAKLIVRIRHHESGVFKNFYVGLGQYASSGKAFVQMYAGAGDTLIRFGDGTRFDVSEPSGQQKLITALAYTMAEAIKADARLRTACEYVLKDKGRKTPER